ncbi:MAG TPA: family 43 glycosylhydrolase, partial [Mucilaginibacter sp.]
EIVAMKILKYGTVLTCLILFTANATIAQNPLITNQYSADPSARVFNGEVYVYPSHDIIATPGHGRMGWFCMQDYHVFSSPNLTDWTDHGVIVSQNTVPWADSTAYSMWAPDCIERNGKYYLYFPATLKSKATTRGGFTVGVAIADKPYGPFVPQAEPIKGIRGIDPNVFIDKDGQAYLYWAQGNIYVAKLKDNMIELASEPKAIENLPAIGLKEGPYLFERKGIYYLTFPHVANKTERLEYVMSNSPTGPFKDCGVMMDESSSGCWTNHQSIIEFKNQWLLFYHNDDLSPNFDKARSIRADSLFFNEDGTIRKVIPTLRGAGITKANKEIQVDRYSDISRGGASINFIDTAQRMKGWKTILNQNKAWVRYNAVDFSVAKLKAVCINAESNVGSMVEIRLDKADGTLIAKVKIAKSVDWKLDKSTLMKVPSGKHDIFIILGEPNPSAIDWVRFY